MSRILLFLYIIWLAILWVLPVEILFLVSGGSAFWIEGLVVGTVSFLLYGWLSEYLSLRSLAPIDELHSPIRMRWEKYFSVYEQKAPQSGVIILRSFFSRKGSIVFTTGYLALIRNEELEKEMERARRKIKSPRTVLLTLLFPILAILEKAMGRPGATCSTHQAIRRIGFYAPFKFFYSWGRKTVGAPQRSYGEEKAVELLYINPDSYL